MKPTARLVSWKEIEGFVEARDKESLKAEINAEGCQAFIKAHREFPQTEYTARKLQEWLGGLPMIRQNLERAFESLDLGTLVEVRQAEPKPTKENQHSTSSSRASRRENRGRSRSSGKAKRCPPFI